MTASIFRGRTCFLPGCDRPATTWGATTPANDFSTEWWACDEHWYQVEFTRTLHVPSEETS